MNEVEFIRTEDGIAAVISKPDGEILVELMSTEEFSNMCRALGME